MKKDKISNLNEMKFGRLRHPLYVHPDVLGQIKSDSPYRKNVLFALESLATYKSTTTVKGCRGNENGKWRRSPLGGGSANHYYLWWRPINKKLSADLGLEQSNAVYVRDIRHHENHSTLKVGASKKICAFRQKDMANSESVYAKESWSEGQLEFINDETAVRLLIGFPGSGKTTALWRSITTRGNQKVLYLTWSQELVQRADFYLKNFSSKGSEIVSLSYTNFLDDMLYGVEQKQLLTIEQSFSEYKRFEERVGALHSRLANISKTSLRMIYAEIRSVVLGKANPKETQKIVVKENYIRLKEENYRQERKSMYEPIFVDKTVDVLVELEKQDAIPYIFNDFVKAYTVYTLLEKNHNFVSKHKGYQRIVVDEIQDLSLIEFYVLLEFCHYLKRKEDEYPILLLTGDDGQIVNPSGFSWGKIKEAITKEFTTGYKEFTLEENLRSSEKVVKVINSSSELYRRIKKSIRPHEQRSQKHKEGFSGEVYSIVASREEISHFLEHGDEYGDICFVTPFDDYVSWINDVAKDNVFKASTIKGLEYQTVCILEPSRLLKEFVNEDDATINKEYLIRIAIDRFRVAISRATESLIFLDITENEALAEDLRKKLKIEKLEKIQILEDLKKDVAYGDIILNSIKKSNDIREKDPMRALKQLQKAVGLLKSDSLREEAETLGEELVKAAALLVCSSYIFQEYEERENIFDFAQMVLKKYKMESLESALKQFAVWHNEPNSSPFSLVETIIESGYADIFQPYLLSKKHKLWEGYKKYLEPLNCDKTRLRKHFAFLSLSEYFGDFLSVMPSVRHKGRHSKKHDMYEKDIAWPEMQNRINKALNEGFSSSKKQAETYIEELNRYGTLAFANKDYELMIKCYQSVRSSVKKLGLPTKMSFLYRYNVLLQLAEYGHVNELIKLCIELEKEMRYNEFIGSISSGDFYKKTYAITLKAKEYKEALKYLKIAIKKEPNVPEKQKLLDSFKSYTVSINEKIMVLYLNLMLEVCIEIYGEIPQDILEESQKLVNEYLGEAKKEQANLIHEKDLRLFSSSDKSNMDTVVVLQKMYIETDEPKDKVVYEKVLHERLKALEYGSEEYIANHVRLSTFYQQETNIEKAWEIDEKLLRFLFRRNENYNLKINEFLTNVCNYLLGIKEPQILVRAINVVTDVMLILLKLMKVREHLFERWYEVREVLVKRTHSEGLEAPFIEKALGIIEWNGGPVHPFYTLLQLKKILNDMHSSKLQKKTVARLEDVLTQELKKAGKIVDKEETAKNIFLQKIHKIFGKNEKLSKNETVSLIKEAHRHFKSGKRKNETDVLQSILDELNDYSLPFPL